MLPTSSDRLRVRVLPSMNRFRREANPKREVAILVATLLGVLGAGAIWNHIYIEPHDRMLQCAQFRGAPRVTCQDDAFYRWPLAQRLTRGVPPSKFK